jgi:hypothetical protein
LKFFALRFGILFLIIFTVSNCYADEIIKGHYCYTYGDNESLKEAKEITRTLAIRNAIESYRVFITSASTVNNFQLTNDLIQIISSGYLKDLKTIEYKEESRTICETIQASVSPQEIEKITKQQGLSSVKRIEELGIDNNGYLKIVGTRYSRGDPSKVYGPKEIEVKVKVLKKILSADEHCIVFVTYYDSEGKELSTDKKTTAYEILLKYGDNKREWLYPGELITYKFMKVPLPGVPESQFVSYKVWLYDDRKRGDIKENK